MRRTALVLLLALLPLHVVAADDAPAQVPFPKDGLDEPTVGIPGMPLELTDGSGDLRRRKATPAKLKLASSFAWGVEFEYVYADPAVGKRAAEEQRVLRIRLTAFSAAGTAHQHFHARLVEMTPEEHEDNAPPRVWNDALTRSSLPGLLFEGTRPGVVSISGIVRHTVVGVGWERAVGASKEADEKARIEGMRTRVKATTEIVARLVREAPSAESNGTFGVTQVFVEFVGVGKRLAISKYRLTAHVAVTKDKEWVRAILWVENAILSNDRHGWTSGSIDAEFSNDGGPTAVPIFAVDDGPVFHLLRINKFRDHRMGYVWP